MNPGQPGAFRVPNPSLLSGGVRVIVRDLAQNVTQRDVSLKDTLAAFAPKSVGVGSTPNPPAVLPQGPINVDRRLHIHQSVLRQQHDARAARFVIRDQIAADLVDFP